MRAYLFAPSTNGMLTLQRMSDDPLIVQAMASLAIGDSVIYADMANVKPGSVPAHRRGIVSVKALQFDNTIGGNGDAVHIELSAPP